MSGHVGAGVQQLYAPEELEKNQSYDLIYNQDRVYIYALNQEICEGSL